MASVLLSTAGAAAGNALLPSGLTVLGTNITGAAIGNAIGAGIGSLADQHLFGAPSQEFLQEYTVEGPRLSDVQVMSSSEGAPIPRAFGRARLSGQLIWATDFDEDIVETVTESTATASSSGGGKGGGGSGATTTQTQRTTTIEYRYFGNFALGLCEGPITRIGRIWADGKLMDLSQIAWRLHTGTETQGPDPLIEAVEGAGRVPAFRGLAYVVFERLPLAPYGNRLPQLQVEVFRALNDVESLIRAVTIIPGATEFGYSPAPQTRLFPGGVSEPLNTNNALGATDWTVAIDQLQDTCPNLARAGLIVAWFGDDLRAGTCTLRPKVVEAGQATTPATWHVSGLDRQSADPVTTIDGRPAYGGTPSDSSVVEALQDLAARGLAVTFYPFIMMDIPPGNVLADPYTGLIGQPQHPWRGRITVDPAPGQPGSPDRSATAAAQVAAFFGSAQPSDFTVTGTNVTYAGPPEWSYRRQILHYAHLCKAAGGVAAFLIGTELRGLTWVRDDTGYPAVAALQQLAADVRQILGPATTLTYAADWSEYFGHQPADGSGDVTFHLDPLWASPHIDVIGIDNYMPLADWRDGQGHLDALAGVPSTQDLAYLRGNIAGGEGFDWFYASDADRTAQTRTPITDGAAGKPWVFRYKDLVNWWSNPHINRVGGVETGGQTAWVPRSKPIWFTELGCPAVDRGANQPNVFFDPKSAESHLPYFSRGLRDDVIQRQFLLAHHAHWHPSSPDFDEADNPVSPLYGGRMVDPDAIHVWTWDARPWPAFPQATRLWSDGDNWRLGHWLTGRLGAVPLGRLVAALMEAQGFSDYDVSGLSGLVDGYIIDRAMSARAALGPLMRAYFFDAVESEGVIRFIHRGSQPVLTTSTDTLAVETGSAAPPLSLTRAQETDLPAASKLSYIEADTGYRQAAIGVQRQTVKSDRVTGAALPVVLRQEEALRIAETGLQDSWIAREQASFALPPSALALDPGDSITCAHNGRSHILRLMRISDGPFRVAEALAAEPGIFGPLSAPERSAAGPAVASFGPVELLFLDLPMLRDGQVPHAPFIATTAKPWPGGVALYRGTSPDDLTLDTALPAPAVMGEVLTDLPAGPIGRWDRANRLQLRLYGGTLESVSTTALLGGANAAVIGDETTGFEVIQFRKADLIAPDTYELSHLLRGQAGSEPEMHPLRAAGARFVLLGGPLRQPALSEQEQGFPFLWRYGPAPAAISHPAYQAREITLAGRGLRPLSPVHLQARRDAAGDIQLTWIRRTRINGDAWEPLDVPLGEDAERYALSISAGGTVIRQLETTLTAFTYTAADQLADTGAPVTALTVTIAQISRAYGPGTPAEAAFHV
ncbi:baseplate multidomain protein megatron [Pyruvatibacter mobilis]|uniref:baseplate multidomain protein megatron n=1 Tax=Pyruvatibacter mobilis TaxID=1712261 RepID=UPI003BABB6C5